MATYPIDQILPSLKAAFLSHPAVVLHAPPGAGKTTRVPLALLDFIPPEQGRIVMLEPRRIAAVTAARWMARSLGEEAGGTIGYAIRFDAKRSSRTRIEVVTEGILTRRIQAEPDLPGTALIIFDEFHERSIHADLALALCLDVRKGLRPDLRILVMSATLDCGPISALLENAPVITSSGRSFPVEDRFVDEAATPLPQAVYRAVKRSLHETDGDTLVFLPGAGEIRACAREMNEAFSRSGERISVHPLYGDLPFEDQERAILPVPDRRKIVLATNIAETSLTIEGVHAVIDSGLTRMLRYDPVIGMNRLVTLPVSRAAAEQRKGRAGRLGPGVCYRLYSRRAQQELLPFAPPEIIVSDLAQLVLELAVWGVRDPADLRWLDAPPVAAWESAVRLLIDLDALGPDRTATSLGRSLARLPLHPRLARLLIRSEELGCPGLGADLAALLTERDLIRRGTDGSLRDSADIAERVETLHRARAGRIPDADIDPSALRAVERTADHLYRLFGGRRSERQQDTTGGEEAVSRLLLAAYPDRICMNRGDRTGRFLHARGRGVRLPQHSRLGISPFIIAIAADAGEKVEGIVHLAAHVTEELLRTECGNRIRTLRRVEWDRKEARIIAAREEALGDLVLMSRPVAATEEEALPLLLDAVRSAPSMLKFGSDARQYQSRVTLLRRTFPEAEWPDLSDEMLFSGHLQWLAPWLGKLRTGAELDRLDIVAVLRSMLTRTLQRNLDELAPPSVIVPSGSRVKLDYVADEGPVLAVKLQEMFGLADTPTVANGRIKVLLYLLSPAGRPVQITRDLKGFWNSGYQQVKRDLKGRYPRHPWPDDPWNAVPTKRTKPRGATRKS